MREALLKLKQKLAQKLYGVGFADLASESISGFLEIPFPLFWHSFLSITTLNSKNRFPKLRDGGFVVLIVGLARHGLLVESATSGDWFVIVHDLSLGRDLLPQPHSVDHCLRVVIVGKQDVLVALRLALFLILHLLILVFLPILHLLLL